VKVFIGHSGDRSKTLAQKVEWFVRNLIPATDPWISTGIEKGSRWEAEIAQNLEDTHVGIVCLTPENLNSRWRLFESGALSKRLDGKVATLLLDVRAEQVEPPLSQFQHTKAERDDVLRLMETINRRVSAAGEKPRRDDDLRDTFDKFWADLESTINEVRGSALSAVAPARKPEEMLAELLDLARANLRQGYMQEKTLKMLQSEIEAITNEPGC
jgi:hypothetical protein